MLLPVHIVAGGIAIVLGAVALAAGKGGDLHRRAGQFFVAAMIVMGCTGAILGVRSGELGNIFAGVMTAYFVLSALTTVRPPSPITRSTSIMGIIAALGIAIVDLLAGIDAFRSPTGIRNGVPFQMFFFLATILVLSAVGDVRVLRSGPLRGRPRLVRHLWRMCFALFIAAGSFFSIRSRVATILPEPFTTLPMRMIPIIFPFAAILYWIWRLRWRRPAPVTVRHGS